MDIDKKIKKYDKKKYNENYKKKKDLNEKMNCEICGGSYTFINKAHHTKTQKHQIAELKKQNNEIKEKLKNEKEEKEEIIEKLKNITCIIKK
jgi:hypothetical protein